MTNNKTTTMSSELFQDVELLREAARAIPQGEMANQLQSLADRLAGQRPIAWADRIAFEDAMVNGKGCDVWPKPGEYTERTGRELIPVFVAPVVTGAQKPAMYWHKPNTDDETFVHPQAVNGYCPDCVPLFFAAGATHQCPTHPQKTVIIERASIQTELAPEENQPRT